MPNAKNDNPKNDTFDFSNALRASVVAATGMTGLAPTVAYDEYEAISYEETYPYLPPVQSNTSGNSDTSAAEGIHAEYRTDKK